MKLRKAVILTVLLGLLLFAFTIGLAKDPSKSAPKTQTACCCCTADSCDMKSKQNHQQHSGEASCCKAKQKTKESKTN